MNVRVDWRIYLEDEGEKFAAPTPTGRIKVEYISASFDAGKVTIIGPAVLKGGGLGGFRRQGAISVNELPEEIREVVKNLMSATESLEAKP